MKTIASMMFLILSTVGAALLSIAAASHFAAEDGPHRFADLSEPPLWTSTPVVVDRSTERYERLPPIYSSYVADAPKVTAAKREAAPAEPVADVRQRPLEEHLASCASRYPSFDPETNKYRSYDGVSRVCSPPADIDAQAGSPGNSKGDAAWCASQYKSYRPADNTYQPYDGGPRRACRAPRYVADAGITD